MDVFDVTFSGWSGAPIKAWYRKPRHTSGPLPTVVQFVGYGGGRGLATENLLWASSGFAHLLMDTRGQGSVWSVGETADPEGSGPHVPGFLTSGILDPSTYYYRRVIADAVRAIDIVSELPEVDPQRIAVVGTSQGAGIALAVSALDERVSALSAAVPFLCDFPRAIQFNDSEPYAELVRYLAIHRGSFEQVAGTLRYFDGVNFARHSNAPALFSVALMDPISKPSTVFGAYNAYVGPKHMEIFPFNGHEGGGAEAERQTVEWVGLQLPGEAG